MSNAIFAAIEQTADFNEWAEPEQIAPELPNVIAINENLLPEPFKPWLSDIAERMQCPLDYVAVGAIVSAVAVIGTGCTIKPKRQDDWQIVPNLWGGIVGKPSMLKTPSLAEAMKPLSKMEAEAMADHEADLREFEVENVIYEARKDALGKAIKGALKDGKEATLDDLRHEYSHTEPPSKPTARRFKTNNATIEKLGEVLKENERGVLLFRDELTGWLNGLEREDRQEDRAFYLECFNGVGSFTVDRIGRGTVHVNNLCLSLLGGIQPDRLAQYLKTAQQGGNDGLVQRLQLFVYPDEPDKWEYVDRYPNKEAKNRAHAIFETLASQDFRDWGAVQDDEESMPYLRFDDDAQELFIEWLHELQNDKLRNPSEHPLMLEHLAKYRSLMPSLALIFHLLNVADGAAAGAVSVQATTQAIAWCYYLESHARRIYATAGNARVQAAAALARKIKQGVLQESFTRRDVQRKQWRHLTEPDDIAKALEDLHLACWLKPVEPDYSGTGRKPAVQYFINPKTQKT